jgi:NADPH:quinone reductase-like Zn-dependent oxidoreductase
MGPPPIGHAHYGKSTGRLGGRIIGGMPYFVGLLLRMLMDPQQRKEFKIRSKLELTTELQGLLESGKLVPVVGKTFPLEGVADAVRWMQEGKALGRIIVTP